MAAALLLLSAPGCGDESIDTGAPSDSAEPSAASQALHEEENETEVVRYGKNGETLPDAKTPHNPTCGDINEEWFECKIDPVESHTYSGEDFADYEDMSEDQKAVCDKLRFEVIKSGETFDWTTNDWGNGTGMGVSAVCVKGGPGANCYMYNKDGTGENAYHDDGLNAFHDKEYGISHVSVCIKPKLDVEKTAKPIWKRIYDWDLKKWVKPAKWNLFDGDTGKSTYTVKATRTKYDKFLVKGKIYIENNTPFDAKITNIIDKIYTKDGKVTPKLKCWEKSDSTKSEIRSSPRLCVTPSFVS